MILNLKHPLGGQVKLAGNPMMMDSLHGQHSPPPLLGQHTSDVLGGILGYPEDRIRSLREEQAANIGETQEHTRKEK
jgi:crotonobetainyl-CoA:carnitine CoA-transferase CaiB-like acyl-CoA transferase